MLKDFIAKLGRPKKIILASVSSLTLKIHFALLMNLKLELLLLWCELIR
jgi:hypothetical protein